MSNKNKHDNLYYFVESLLIPIILTIFIIYTLLNNYIDFHSSYQSLFDNSVREALNNLKGSLLSVATIFIGIYVTVYTLLGSIKVDSIFAYLNEKTFEKLITFIKNAFIASFSYILLIMFLEIFYPDFEKVHFLFLLLNASIVIYMFLTALRFGIILYIAFNKDLKNLHDNIIKHRDEKRELEELQYRLKKYLDEFEEKQRLKQSKKMSEIIRNTEEEHKRT